MEKLTEKSKKIVERFKIHRDRCLSLAFLLGEDSANAFHLRFKGNPCCGEAKQEYEKLIKAAGN